MHPAFAALVSPCTSSPAKLMLRKPVPDVTLGLRSRLDPTEYFHVIVLPTSL